MYISGSSRVCKQMSTMFELSHDLQSVLLPKLYMHTKHLLLRAEANVANIIVYNANIARMIDREISLAPWGIGNNALHHKSINYHEWIDMAMHAPFTSHFDVITYCVAEMEQRTEAAKNRFDILSSVDILSLTDTRAWKIYNDDLNSARLIYSHCRTELNSWKWASKCINIQTIQESRRNVLNLKDLCARYHRQLVILNFTQADFARMVNDDDV